MLFLVGTSKVGLLVFLSLRSLSVYQDLCEVSTVKYSVFSLSSYETALMKRISNLINPVVLTAMCVRLCAVRQTWKFCKYKFNYNFTKSTSCNRKKFLLCIKKTLQTESGEVLEQAA